eukprot:SAG31_NODE_2263_length_6060_cov_12.232344_3_plen_363_part_00
MQWAAIPRREHTNLSYSQFLREFALPGIPVILQGDPGHGWPAKYHWNTLSGLKSRGLDMNEEVQVQLGGDGVATMPLSDCLESFEARKRTKALNRNPMSPLRSVDGVKRQRCTGGHSIAAGSSCASPAVHSAIAGSAGPAYLRNWRFHERNPHLLQDFTIPPLFELDFAVEAGLIQRHSFTWLYIGEDGSSTPTHVDVMNTGAWLYLTAGQKRWRMVSGTLLPHCYPSLPAASPAEGGDSLGGSMVDLFDDEAASSALRDVARNEPGCYEGVLRPGEIIFTPSKCAHAVVNDGLTIAVTSNFVDLGNLVDVCEWSLPWTLELRLVPCCMDVICVSFTSFCVCDCRRLAIREPPKRKSATLFS